MKMSDEKINELTELSEILSILNQEEELDRK